MNDRHMISLSNETKQIIEEKLELMTAVECTIAEFFLENKEIMDFSSKNISKIMYISEATLSRFAKKCGYKGYREFIFSYMKDLEYEHAVWENEKEVSIFTKKVQGSYNNLLNENFALVDEMQFKRIADMLNQNRKTIILGMGSSGYAAMDFQLRFMRLGLEVTAITDSQMMQMKAALSGEGTLLIAISLSGKTQAVTDSIKTAKKQGAEIIFITAAQGLEIEEYCDEILRIASIKNLDTGTRITPQFSILIMMDILYAYYFANDSYFKTQKYKDTLSAIRNHR